MDHVKTQVLRHEDDVDSRLGELGLKRSTLLEIRDIAVAAARNATEFHPTNASGTFSYQEGTWALRDRHIGEGWIVDRSHSVEAIKNEDLGVKVVFSNVDLACDDEQGPKPRSKKGAGGERAFSGNLFGESLPQYAPRPADGVMAYYLMVDERGAAELTRPILKGGTFIAYLERIYLSDGSDLQLDRLPLDEVDQLNEFDPLVARK